LTSRGWIESQKRNVRAVDVNRPVRLWRVPDAVLAALALTVNGGVTSTARLVTVKRIQSTKSGVLNIVSQPQLPPIKTSTNS